MPYKALEELPVGLQRTLPLRAQEVYQTTFNSAWVTYANKSKRGSASREEVAHRIAWSAVKRQYDKSFMNAWRRRRGGL
jgi:cation transport regulator